MIRSWQHPVDLHDITLYTVVIAMEMKEQDDESQRLWIIASSLHEAFQSTITVIMLAQDRSRRNVIKGIVHFEINFRYVLAYLKGIQDVGVFCFHSIFNFDIFRSNRCCLLVI